MFEKGASQAEVARTLGVSRVTAMEWHHAWRKGGRAALMGAERLGRPVRLNQKHVERLKSVLIKGAQASGYSTNVWTLPRVAEVIERITRIHYHPGHVWRVLRSLGWSHQKPTTRAVERDEKKIADWIQYRWPRVKKTPESEKPQ